MRARHILRAGAVAAVAVAALAAPGGAAADGGGAPGVEAGPPEIVSVTYYDRRGRAIRAQDNCWSMPERGRISPACGLPTGCGEIIARHGFDHWFGSVYLYHHVYWCWSNGVVAGSSLRSHWRVIGTGICGAGEPSSWRSGGGNGASYVSYRSQVDVHCVTAWVHTTVWMDIAYGGNGGAWALAWSNH